MNKNENFLLISKLKQTILNSVEKFFITLISTPTGSGKSTLIPQIIYSHFAKNNPKIIISEPRFIASQTISNFISNSNPNLKIVSNDLNCYYNENYSLLFLKEYELLCLLSKNPYLEKCDFLIIDEIHERTMKLDLILFYIKYYTLTEMNRKRKFRLILLSAKFNINNIVEYL